MQQTSNITYRIYDYNRPGLDGKPRQLHTEEAKEAIDYKVYPDYRTHYVARPGERVELVKCPFFTTSLYDMTVTPDQGTPQISDLQGPRTVGGDAVMPGSTGHPATVREDISGLPKYLAFICMEGFGTVNGVSVSAGEVVLLSPDERTLEISGHLKALTTHE